MNSHQFSRTAHASFFPLISEASKLGNNHLRSFRSIKYQLNKQQCSRSLMYSGHRLAQKLKTLHGCCAHFHLVPSRPRQVLKCESRQAHICRVGRSEESWLLRAMYTVAWPRKRSLEAGDVQTRLLSSSAKCISSIYYTINTTNTIYVYLHNHPFQTFLADLKLVSNSNRSCIVFLLWGIDLRTVLATHLSSEWRFRGKGGQVAPTCKNVGF